MEDINEEGEYCSYCGTKVEKAILHDGDLFCSQICEKHNIASKEKYHTLIKLRSIRSFKSEKIEEKVLRNILEAGRHTPSAHNIQPWHFVVVSEPETKKKLAMNARFIEDSALSIVGCGDPEESPQSYKLEVAIALQSMVMAAWIQGIGSCWVDVRVNEKKVKEILGIPERLIVVALVAFGYPVEIPEPAWKKPLNQIVHYNEF